MAGEGVELTCPPKMGPPRVSELRGAPLPGVDRSSGAQVSIQEAQDRTSAPPARIHLFDVAKRSEGIDRCLVQWHRPSLPVLPLDKSLEDQGL